jgi:hypothetical protein
VNEQTGLAMIHTLFVTELKQINKSIWIDEILFQLQETRHIVATITKQIWYHNDILPMRIAQINRSNRRGNHFLGRGTINEPKIYLL